MITIHKHRVKEYVDPLELLEKYRTYLNLTDSGNVSFAMEYHGKYAQLHMHALICGVTNRWYRVKLKDYRVYCRNMDTKDYKKCLNYIWKLAENGYRQSQILDENYYRYHHSFIN